MHQVAQGLASLGRGEDKMLVHMTPGEVQGLQRLAMAHGGSLTINPQTGLPEAGFLSSLLPTVIGLALAPETGGASLGLTSAWQTAALVGGASALMNKSLSKGLMAGLGAYGGAGLGNALAETGAQTANTALLEKAASEGSEAARGQLANYMQTLPPESMLTPEQMVKGAMPGMNAAQEAQLAQLTRMGVTDPNAIAESLGSLKGGAEASLLSPSYKTAASAANQFMTNPAQVAGDVYDRIGMRGALTVASPLITAGLGSLAQQNTLAPGTVPVGTPAMIRPYTYRPGAVNPAYTKDITSAGYSKSPYFLDQGYTEQTPYRAAAGGQVPSPSLPLDLSQNYPGSNISKSSYATLPATESQEVVDGYGPKINPFTGAEGMAGGGAISRLIEQINAAKALENPRANMMQYAYEPDDQQYTEMAAGGIASLPEYAAGGKLLRGPGDGMSDDIPAVIKGAKPQRAALADGEFVIPADVVSHLGNGSTDAGAKRLYGMMDKVRQARTGRKAQGRQINAEKYIPA